MTGANDATSARHSSHEPRWASNAWRSSATASQRDDGMRAATSVDANFPALTLRQETAGPNRAYAPNVNSIDVEVYNPYYFRVTRACQYIVDPKPCFQPIYVLDCFDTTELTYQQPIAFWSAAYEHVVSTEIPGAVGARSAVFGFPLVYCNPSQVKEAVEYILFDEWQLPRRTGNATASASR